jgi:hypothetical protein
MRLNKLFILILALPLALVACKKSEAPKVDTEYLFNINMTQAERITKIAEGGQTLSANQFMLQFTDKEQSGTLSLFIQGEDGETTLSAGSYKSLRGALVLESSLYVTKDNTSYPFTNGEGIVEVSLSEDIYTIVADITDAKGNKFHFTYEGAIENMSESSKYDVHAELNLAERLLPAEKYEISDGDIGMLFSSGGTNHLLTVVLTPTEGEDVITAGTYSTELGNLKIEEGFYVPSTSNPVEHKFVSGEVKVEGNVDGYSFDMLFIDSDEKTYHFIYNGSIKRMMVNFEDPEYYARCHGYYEGPTYNFTLWLGRNISRDYENSPIKQRFVLDIYSAKVEKDANGNYKIPNGTYKLDPKNSTNEWTIAQQNSCLEFGTAEIFFRDATLEVTDDSLTFTATEYLSNGAAGAVFTVKYSGETIAIEDNNFKAEPEA